MTQEQLAQSVGLTREYISLLELDKRLPTIPVFVRLCRALKMTTAEVVQLIDSIDWPAPAVTSRPVKPPVQQHRLKR